MDWYVGNDDIYNGAINNSLSHGNHAGGNTPTTPFATLLLLLLLLLVVIYDGVGTYDEMIILDWYVGQWWWIMSTYLLNLLPCPCLFFFPKDNNYYSIIPSINVQLDDAVDCYIWWCCFGTDDLVHGWQCNDYLWWCHDQYCTCRVWWMMYRLMGIIRSPWVRYETDNNTTEPTTTMLMQ